MPHVMSCEPERHVDYIAFQVRRLDRTATVTLQCADMPWCEFVCVIICFCIDVPAFMHKPGCKTARLACGLALHIIHQTSKFRVQRARRHTIRVHALRCLSLGKRNWRCVYRRRLDFAVHSSLGLRDRANQDVH